MESQNQDVLVFSFKEERITKRELFKEKKTDLWLLVYGSQWLPGGLNFLRYVR